MHHMNRWVVVALVVVAVVSTPSPCVAAAQGDVLPFKATESTLPNGLRVIVVPTGFPSPI
jgi:zinc protease